MRVSFLLSIAVLTAVASSLFLLVSPSADITEYLMSWQWQNNNADLLPEANAKSLPLQIDELYKNIREVAVDNTTALYSFGYLKIDQNYIDDTRHCEFCTRVEYVSSTIGTSGFAYEDKNGFDLTGAKRVKFLILGESGGESVSFRAAGKTLPEGKALKDIFRKEKFAVYTENITLDKKWETVEIDLQGKDLTNITHPLAFELTKTGDQEGVVFYIKDIVYDLKAAENPVSARKVPAADS
jgi:hypothetical protein